MSIVEYRNIYILRSTRGGSIIYVIRYLDFLKQDNIDIIINLFNI